MELVSYRSSGVQRFEMASKYLENLSTRGVNQFNTEEMCDSEHQFLYFVPIFMVKINYELTVQRRALLEKHCMALECSLA